MITTITQNDLNLHLKFLHGDLDGKRLVTGWGVIEIKAELRGANLSRSDLSRSDLSGADLSGADLSRSDLSGADLTEAELSEANMRWADLRGTCLRGAKNIPDYVDALTSILHEGTIYGYKKCAFGEIVKLRIDEGVKRSNATGRKCRSESAYVVAIWDSEGVEIDAAPSGYDRDFVYRVGETVSVSNFDTDRWNECASGIHWFITRYEAENY